MSRNTKETVADLALLLLAIIVCAYMLSNRR